jgi:integrase
MARHLINSDRTILSTQITGATQRLSDGDGLYLLIKPNGSRWWRFDYSIAGKRKTLSLGVYPDTGIKAARDKAQQAREQVAADTDPSDLRKAKKQKEAQVLEAERRDRAGLPSVGSFEEIARQWFARVSQSLAETTSAKNLKFLESDVFPFIGRRNIADLAAPDLVVILKRIEGRGANDIARRVYNLCGRIFRYAVSHGLCERDPSRDIEISDILMPVKIQHHASVTDPKGAGELLRATDGFTGSFTTRCALRLAPLVFVRPGELRHAEWTELDFDAAEWRIPASKMKMREQHIVPLSKQAIEVLRDIQQVTGDAKYVFPSERTSIRPMSENTINAALRRLGYTSNEMTGHGYRSMASTLLHELGYPHQVIERQLAHGERNKVSAAYNFAEHLPERRKMMQEWADYLDTLRKGGQVIPLFANAK